MLLGRCKVKQRAQHEVKNIQNKLIKSLEEERDRLQNELNKYTKEGSAALFTNKAIIAKDKALHDLAQFELESINKINKADIKSEFAQTEISGIENIIISKRPDEMEKPSKPRKNYNS